MVNFVLLLKEQRCNACASGNVCPPFSLSPIGFIHKLKAREKAIFPSIRIKALTKTASFIILLCARKRENQRGVAQMVARMVRDHEVVGSNPVTPTKKKP